MCVVTKFMIIKGCTCNAVVLDSIFLRFNTCVSLRTVFWYCTSFRHENIKYKALFIRWEIHNQFFFTARSRVVLGTGLFKECLDICFYKIWMGYSLFTLKCFALCLQVKIESPEVKNIQTEFFSQRENL